MATISDRVCPHHGDIGATPSMNFCSECGAHLEMKSFLRSSAESFIPTVATGVAIGAGFSLGDHIGDTLSEGIGSLSDIF